jgi:hypothetical protein
VKKWVVLTTAAAFLLVSAAPADARIRLTESMAWDYADLTMSRKYQDAWVAYQDYYNGDITCRKRVRRLVRRCKANWSPGGDVGYRTRLRVIWRGTYSHHRVRVVGHTKITDYYCLNVSHPGDWSKCTSVHRVGPVRYRFGG